jgi:hypothetical protein
MYLGTALLNWFAFICSPNPGSSTAGIFWSDFLDTEIWIFTDQGHWQ